MYGQWKRLTSNAGGVLTGKGSVPLQNLLLSHAASFKHVNFILLHHPSSHMSLGWFFAHITLKPVNACPLPNSHTLQGHPPSWSVLGLYRQDFHLAERIKHCQTECTACTSLDSCLLSGSAVADAHQGSRNLVRLCIQALSFLVCMCQTSKVASNCSG